MDFIHLFILHFANKWWTNWVLNSQTISSQTIASFKLVNFVSTSMHSLNIFQSLPFFDTINLPLSDVIKPTRNLAHGFNLVHLSRGSRRTVAKSTPARARCVTNLRTKFQLCILIAVWIFQLLKNKRPYAQPPRGAHKMVNLLWLVPSSLHTIFQLCIVNTCANALRQTETEPDNLLYRYWYNYVITFLFYIKY